MSIDSYGAKLTKRDVVDLATASTQLASVADTIRATGVRWGDAAINLLIAANQTVVRIQTKGAAAFARYLEKHPNALSEEPAPAKNLDEFIERSLKTTSDDPEE